MEALLFYTLLVALSIVCYCCHCLPPPDSQMQKKSVLIPFKVFRLVCFSYPEAFLFHRSTTESWNLDTNIQRTFIRGVHCTPTSSISNTVKLAGKTEELTIFPCIPLLDKWPIFKLLLLSCMYSMQISIYFI